MDIRMFFKRGFPTASTLELRGGAHHLITTQVSRMKAALFAVPSSDLLDGVFESR